METLDLSRRGVLLNDNSWGPIHWKSSSGWSA